MGILIEYLGPLCTILINYSHQLDCKPLYLTVFTVLLPFKQVAAFDASAAVSGNAKLPPPHLP